MLPLNEVFAMAVIAVMTGAGMATVFKLLFGDETTTKRAFVMLVGIAGVIFAMTYLLKLVAR